MAMRLLSTAGVTAWFMILTPPALADTVDLGAAEAQFKKSCGICHAAIAEAKPRQGPNLFGIVGREAGTVPGFNYSAAFVAGDGGVVWDESTLDRWLADPQSVIPGSVMLYKQADPEKRRLVIEYLKTRR
jgi:cytochrome c